MTSHPTLAIPVSDLARRDLPSFTADAEKRLLIAIARRLPGWVGPDHLTALGAFSMLAAGVCYRLVALTPLALAGVNFFLFLNWFGDSLDGTLARVRGRQRPRYGFYVDHLIDAAGAIALMGGLCFSGLVPPGSAVALLLAYLLLLVHIALKAHATGVFQIAFSGVGGTEARILLAGLNTVLAIAPLPVGATGLVLCGVAVSLVAVVARDALKTGRALDRAERALWTAAGSSASLPTVEEAAIR